MRAQASTCGWVQISQVLHAFAGAHLNPDAAHLHVLCIAAAPWQRDIQVAALQLMREGLGLAVHGEGEDRGVALKDGRCAVALQAWEQAGQGR